MDGGLTTKPRKPCVLSILHDKHMLDGSSPTFDMVNVTMLGIRMWLAVAIRHNTFCFWSCIIFHSLIHKFCGELLQFNKTHKYFYNKSHRSIQSQSNQPKITTTQPNPTHGQIQSTEERERTCWKPLIAFPMLRPISGSFLGPKSRAATPAMTTSSGTPSPNKQRQSRPVCALFLVKTIVLLFFNRNSFLPLLKKRDLQEDKEALWGVLGRVGRRRLEAEISIFFCELLRF